MRKTKKVDHNTIPKQVELFGRTVKTLYDASSMANINYGQAKPGHNQIVLNDKIRGEQISNEELKLTYLHEMLHFIFIFTNYDPMIRNGEKIDIEQLIELLSSAIYQYEKTAKY